MNKLSDGEWKLMELLWEESPVNSTRLVERCRERLTWSKSTTYTVLRRLCRKGAAVNEGASFMPKIMKMTKMMGSAQMRKHQRQPMLGSANADMAQQTT